MKSKVTNFISSEFGDRVVCLLHYGSQVFGKVYSSNPDFDFMLILNEPNDGDLEVIKRFVSMNKNVDLSVHYKNYIDIKGLENFQQGNHGVFFLKYLTGSECLLGLNIFTSDINIPKHKEVESLLAQCEEYFFRLRSIFIEDDSNDWKEYFLKYFYRIIIDLLILKCNFLYSDINKTSRQEIIDMVRDSDSFSIKTKELLRSTLNMSNIKTSDLLALYKSLYLDYLNIYKFFLSHEDAS